MIPHPGAIVALGLLVATALPAQHPEPIRMATPAFGTTAEVEARDLPAAAAGPAVEAALTEIFALSQLTDPQGGQPGGIGLLNRHAGQGRQIVDPRVAELLLRGLQFCIWSGGAYGPLGGHLRQIWSERPDPGRPPAVGDLRLAVGHAECSRLKLRSAEPAAGQNRPGTTAELAAGSRVDLAGIARGYAIDRAVEILEAHGARNVWVEIGDVWRARGGGPDGRGWLAELPTPQGHDEPLDLLWLRDQALAIVGFDTGNVPVIDQRTGVPPQGVVSVVAVTELAVDAEPLVRALFVLGHREGHMRLGTLQPRPSVYWLLGQGVGAPLEATYRWSELERVRR